MNSNNYRSISHIFRGLNPRSTLMARARFSTPTEQPPPPSEKVSEIATELSTLTLLEVSDLTQLLRAKLGSEEMKGMHFGPGGPLGGPAHASKKKPMENTSNV